MKLRDALNKSFDKLRTNRNLMIPFVVSLSNHERNQVVESIPRHRRRADDAGIYAAANPTLGVRCGAALLDFQSSR